MERRERRKVKEFSAEGWAPRTSLGKKVVSGEITNIMQVFDQGSVIREPEIVDALIPDLEEEVLLIGGVPGKGGGKKRIPLRSTTRMHRAGRKRTMHAMMAVGNKNGVVGIGYASGLDARSAIQKAAKQARLNLIYIRRGCGSWQCACKTPHSIPMQVSAKVGSVDIRLMPAPKGAELKVAAEIKKVMRLAGLKDLWGKAKGQTGTVLNFVKANMLALKKLNRLKLADAEKEHLGLIEGPVK